MKHHNDHLGDSGPGPPPAREGLSSARMRQIIEFLPDATFVIDQHGRVEAWNKAIEEMTGVPAEKMIGQGNYEYAIPFYGERRPVMIDLVISGDESFDDEYRHVNRRGDRFDSESFIPDLRPGGAYLYNTARCLYDEEGRIVGAIESIRDITEQKRAEQEVSGVRQKLEDIINFLPDAAFVIDHTGVVQMWNHAMEALTGIAAGDIIGKGNYEYALPFYGERRPLLIDLVLSWDDRYEDRYISLKKSPDGVLISESHHPLLKDGIYLSGTARALYGPDGMPVGAIETLRDITEIKKAQKALRESGSRYWNLFESIRDAILVADTEGQIIDCNAAFIDLFGYQEMEIPELKAETIHEDERQFRELQTALEGKGDKTSDPLTVNYVKKSGTVFPGETGVFHFKDEEGRITGTITLIRDVSERQVYEKNLRESESRLKSLVENLFDAVMVINHDGVIRFLNQAACQLFGRERDALVGSDFGFPIMEDGAHEIQVHQKGGGLRYAEIQASPSRWGDEPVYLASIRDTTESVTARREREKLNEHLQQIQRLEAIGTLAGGIAHDFNNILTPILGFSELAMERAKADDLVHECLGHVHRSAKRAKELVGQILAFSRQGEQTYHPVMMEPIVKEVSKLIRSALPTTIDIHMDINSRGMIMGNGTEVHQILMNLCTNAKQAMEESGGILGIRLDDVELTDAASRVHPDLKDGSYVHLQVKDTGSGMPPEIVEKIFEPYYTTKDIGKGTGLGLSVVHGIVTNYGGAITVESRAGHGTAFDVYLPRTQISRDETPDPHAALPTGDERILLVDDEPSVLKLHNKMLSQLGYDVTPFQNGFDALSAFEAAPNDFDLILTDMTMPGMTGDALADRCLVIRADVPIILSTGFSENLTEEAANRHGIRAFLMKPVEKRRLATAIRSTLDGDGRSLQGPGKDADAT